MANINGTLGGDILDGTSGNDNIDGGRGNDIIKAGLGNDIISGGLGNDTLYGGAGNDTFVHLEGDDITRIKDFTKGEDIIAIDIRGVDSIDDLLNNALNVNYENNRIEILYDVNNFIIIDGLGIADMGNLASYFVFDHYNGTGSGDDTFISGGGNDVINGFTGDDYLDGGAGNDTIDGGRGDDVVIGGAGDDIISGNAGRDELHGGAGNDTFVHLSGDDITEIFDFNKAEDLIRLEMDGFNSFQDVIDNSLLIQEEEAGTLEILIDNNNFLVVHGLGASDIVDMDDYFVFA